MMPAVPEIEAYVRAAAIARGIDPDIAVRVAKHEGLNVFDPTKPDLGGDENSSFGPFQLHYGGISKNMPRGGLGDDFTKATGLHARDPSTWKQQVDFSLDTVARDGWNRWMGAKAEGITGKMGVAGNAAPKGVTITSHPYSAGGAAVVPVGTKEGTSETPSSAASPDQAAPAAATPAAAATTAAEPQGWADKLKALAENKDLSDLTSAFGGGDKKKAEQQKPADTNIASILPSLEGADMARIQAAQSLMSTIIGKNRAKRGLTLTGVPSGLA
jgi:hypothetical protein